MALTVAPQLDRGSEFRGVFFMDVVAAAVCEIFPLRLEHDSKWAIDPRKYRVNRAIYPVNWAHSILQFFTR